MATRVVFLTHIAVEKASDAGLAPPPVLVGAAVAVCGTSYVVKKIHRKNLRNRNNRRSSKQKVPFAFSAMFWQAIETQLAVLTICCFCRLSSTRHLTMLTTSLLSCQILENSSHLLLLSVQQLSDMQHLRLQGPAPHEPTGLL